MTHRIHYVVTHVYSQHFCACVNYRKSSFSSRSRDRTFLFVKECDRDMSHSRNAENSQFGLSMDQSLDKEERLASSLTAYEHKSSSYVKKLQAWVHSTELKSLGK